MRFSTDEIKPFYEVRQNLSKAIDDVAQDGGEVVIAKHGKPVAALISAEGLYRYREVDGLLVQLLDVLALRTEATKLTVDAQVTEIASHFKTLGGSKKSGGNV
jgi:prevent-host-death family protein